MMHEPTVILRGSYGFRFLLASSRLGAFALISLIGDSVFADSLFRLKVEAGASPRLDTPVFAQLPAEFGAYRPMHLVEVKGTERMPVPFQVDPDEGPGIWWILSGESGAGTERTFELEEGGASISADAPAIHCDMDASTLRISRIENGKSLPIFSYNHAFVLPPAGVAPAFIRSGYIQPLFSPTGRLMTEDFPADHYHHKGIWFPWTQTEFEGHAVDFWNLGDKKGTVRYAGFNSISSGPVFGEFGVTHEHVDLQRDQAKGGRVALNESWTVRVYNVGGPATGYWLFDLVSTQTCASPSPLKLLEYRYGGLGFRGAKEWKDENYKALSSEGKTHLNGHTTRAKWCDHSGRGNAKADGSGATEWNGVTIMDHPANFRFPQSMRLWDKNGCFFCYAPVQLGEFKIEPGQQYISRYRFYVHEGEPNVETINRLWNDWGDPPKVTVVTSK